MISHQYKCTMSDVEQCVTRIVQKTIINDKEVMFMSKLYHECKRIVSQTEGKDASNY